MGEEDKLEEVSNENNECSKENQSEI
jgi:hypothetical protein